MNEIKKNNLEKAIQNLDNSHIKQILQNCSLSFSVELLSVEKNLQLLCKKTRFPFLLDLFSHLNSLHTNKYVQFLKISNTSFWMEEHKAPIFIDSKKEVLNNFIIKVIDFSIFTNKSKNKHFILEDIQDVIQIGKKFNISNEKIINWMGKMYSQTHQPEIILSLSKEPLLNNPELKERFISVVLNSSKNLDILDSLFNAYEKNIYEIYAEYKSNGRTWNFLLPKSYWYSRINYLPYSSEEKVDWFEKKHLGYNHHPTPFKILHVFQQIDSYRGIQDNPDLTKLIEDESYKNLIYDSLIDYKSKLLPLIDDCFKKFILSSQNTSLTLPDNFHSSKEFKELKEDLIKNQHYKILFNFYENKKILDFCEKISFKTKIEDKFSNVEKPKKTIKI